MKIAQLEFEGPGYENSSKIVFRYILNVNFFVDDVRFRTTLGGQNMNFCWPGGFKKSDPGIKSDMFI